MTETNASTIGQLVVTKGSEVYVGSSKTMTKYDLNGVRAFQLL